MAPNCTQLLPPSVVRRMPASGPPRPPKELACPMPARRTSESGKVGSSASDSIDKLGWWSVRGVHVGDAAVAFVVFQTPPFTPPIQTMSALVGCTTIALMAPARTPFVAAVWNPAGPFSTNVTGRIGFAPCMMATRLPPIERTTNTRAVLCLGDIVMNASTVMNVALMVRPSQAHVTIYVGRNAHPPSALTRLSIVRLHPDRRGPRVESRAFVQDSCGATRLPRRLLRRRERATRVGHIHRL